MIELNNELLGRALAERFVATLFLGAPDRDWLAGLASSGTLDEFPISTDGPTGAAVRAMTSTCRLLAEGDDAEANAVTADYERLFLGPQHVLAPPWESVYRSEEHLLFDRHTFEVREAYARMGLRTAVPEMADDHIGLELLYLAMLDERASDGDSAALDARRQFVRQHLQEWVPALCADIIHHAATPFWRAVATLTLELIHEGRS